jgi:hypothetical protein
MTGVTFVPAPADGEAVYTFLSADAAALIPCVGVQGLFYFM